MSQSEDSKSIKYKDQLCGHCGNYANRGISVDAICVNDRNEILLIKRGNEPFRGYWGLIGGYMEWDETAEDALVREVNEEVNLEVLQMRQIHTYTRPSRHPKQSITIVFQVEAKGKPKAGDDAVEARYFPLSDLPKVLAFEQLEVIEDYKKYVAESGRPSLTRSG